MQEHGAPEPAGAAPTSAPPIPLETFKMIDPAPFCGGANEREHYLTALRLNFKSHRPLFPRGDADYVRYAMGFLKTW